jgi:hypothetical protein
VPSLPHARNENDRKEQPCPDDDRTIEAPQKARELGDRRREEASQNRPREKTFPAPQDLRGLSRSEKAGAQDHAEERE